MRVPIPIVCTSCQGEGFHEADAPGRFDVRAEVYVPAGGLEECGACGGSGDIEVCPVCRAPLDWSAAGETCCCATGLRRAA